MSELLDKAIYSVRNSEKAFCKYITANDVGETGSHQSGFYIPKDSWTLFFNSPGIKGSNKDQNIHIKWNDDFYTDSRAIYYGEGSRNEYRVTTFGRGFPYLKKHYSGSLLIMTKIAEKEYTAHVLSQDEDIEDFFSVFDISPSDNRHLIDVEAHASVIPDINSIIGNVISSYTTFPSTSQMSSLARDIKKFTNKKTLSNPDLALMEWINSEYQLFKAFEEREFHQKRKEEFKCCQDLIDFSNSLLNRRKSRAGKSLEHHLAHIFTIENLKFEEQVVTEGKKKPDFIFPDGESYHNLLFPGEGLTFLGAKTTCKDRWRQVLNEADRIPHKYLFTLQQGISSNQLEEMKQENLTLVVPKSNLESFAIDYRSQLLTLSNFINLVKEKQETYGIL